MSIGSSVLAPLQVRIWFDRPDIFFKDAFGFAPYVYQADFMKIWNDYKNHKRTLVVAAGGTGKTQLLAGVALFFAVVLAKIESDAKAVIILSGSLLQARNVYKFIRDAIQNNPIIKEMVDSHRQSDTEFKDGSNIKALSSSLRAVQGQHGDIVIVDEAALVEDFQLDDCYRIIGAHDGVMLWSGTPTVYSSKYVQIFEETQRDIKANKDTLWEIWAWSAKDCPRLVAQMEEAKNRLPEDVWKIFWEGIPYPLSGTLIPRDAMVSAVRGVTKFKYNPEWYTIIGVDWGWGHPSAVIVVQTDGQRYVVLHARQWKETDFDYIHGIIEQWAKDYSAFRIYVDGSDKGENLRLRKRALPVFEVAFNKEKAMMQSRMRDVFIKEDIKIPEEDYEDFQELIYQLRTYTWTKKINEDLVDALQLALKEVFPSEVSRVHIASGRARRRKRNIF